MNAFMNHLIQSRMESEEIRQIEQTAQDRMDGCITGESAILMRTGRDVGIYDVELATTLRRGDDVNPAAPESSTDPQIRYYPAVPNSKYDVINGMKVADPLWIRAHLHERNAFDLLHEVDKLWPIPTRDASAAPLPELQHIGVLAEQSAYVYYAKLAEAHTSWRNKLQLSSKIYAAIGEKNTKLLDVEQIADVRETVKERGLVSIQSYTDMLRYFIWRYVEAPKSENGSRCLELYAESCDMLREVEKKCINGVIRELDIFFK